MSKSPQRQEPDTPERTIKQPTSPSRRPRDSEHRTFDDRDKWANSSGLQPPK